MVSVSVKVSTAEAKELAAKLTPRELEVVQEKFKGETSEMVADGLCISPRTVHFHLGNVYYKLGVNNLTQALRRLAPALSL